VNGGAIITRAMIVIRNWFVAIMGLAIIFVGIYVALKPSYNERLETNSTRLLNDTVLRVDVGSERFTNCSSLTTYIVPGELQYVNISGIVEDKANDLFLFKIIDGIEFKLNEAGTPDYIYYYIHRVIGTAHFNISVKDFTILQVGVYFIVGNHWASKTIEVEVRNVNITWTYKILYGEYHPGAIMGVSLIILGSILMMVGIKKGKANLPRSWPFKLVIWRHRTSIWRGCVHGGT
jgi:hypothetical protein